MITDSCVKRGEFCTSIRSPSGFIFQESSAVQRILGSTVGSTDHTQAIQSPKSTLASMMKFFVSVCVVAVVATAAEHTSAAIGDSTADALSLNPVSDTSRTVIPSKRPRRCSIFKEMFNNMPCKSGSIRVKKCEPCVPINREVEDEYYDYISNYEDDSPRIKAPDQQLQKSSDGALTSRSMNPFNRVKRGTGILGLSILPCPLAYERITNDAPCVPIKPRKEVEDDYESNYEDDSPRIKTPEKKLQTSSDSDLTSHSKNPSNRAGQGTGVLDLSFLPCASGYVRITKDAPCVRLNKEEEVEDDYESNYENAFRRIKTPNEQLQKFSVGALTSHSKNSFNRVKREVRGILDISKLNVPCTSAKESVRDIKAPVEPDYYGDLFDFY
ncbi:unnamed protein product [Chrysodeixis includens]|uniref:Uncharacterized protein n=1 Tax=Chrysodeixis includens TaxID=689277 RepID=A0A9P0FWU6_CHRIL|nr:unnamed protein product [Chrysodeixis includens]